MMHYTLNAINPIRLFLLMLLTAIFLIAIAQPVAAEEDIINNGGICVQNPSATLCEDNTDQDINSNSIFGPNGIITRAAQLLAVVVGVASVVVIISSGIQYAISSGDPTRLNRAKDTLLYALIGLVIAMSAQAIIVFVLRRIG